MCGRAGRVPVLVIVMRGGGWERWALRGTHVAGIHGRQRLKTWKELWLGFLPLRCTGWEERATMRDRRFWPWLVGRLRRTP